jgi:hypothetical protein
MCDIGEDSEKHPAKSERKPIKKWGGVALNKVVTESACSIMNTINVVRNPIVARQAAGVSTVGDWSK